MQSEYFTSCPTIVRDGHRSSATFMVHYLRRELYSITPANMPQSSRQRHSGGYRRQSLVRHSGRGAVVDSSSDDFPMSDCDVCHATSAESRCIRARSEVGSCLDRLLGRKEQKVKHAGRRFLRALADAEGIVTISCSEWAPGLAEAATAPVSFPRGPNGGLDWPKCDLQIVCILFCVTTPSPLPSAPLYGETF